MNKYLLYASLITLLTACTARSMSDDQLPANIRGQVKIIGHDLPASAVNPMLLNVLFDNETTEELERMTGEDGYVQLPLVKSFDGRGIVRMRRLFPEAGRFEARTRREGLHRWYEVYYDTSVSITKAAEGWVSIPGVELVELNPLIHIVGNPVLVEDNETMAVQTSASAVYPFDDPRLPSQWHYLNKGTVASSASGCDINVVPVWKKYTTGAPEVIVGVVDGGVDYNHEDLAANMWHNPEKKGDSQYGYNFATDNYKINPENHGTHVAGTIAAVNNNGIGVAGIAGGNAAEGQPGVKIMSCQIFDEKGDGSGAAAIKWSADHGAVISQNSWGFDNASETPKSLMAAVDYFIKYAGIDENDVQTGPMRGGIVIFAAGNDNTDTSGNSYEAIFNVASVGADYYRAYYSNYGDWIDISAPGGDVKKGNQVLSTLVGNKYGLYQGTSMACPHVSGVAALIISKYQGEGLTPDEVERRIVESATPIQSFNKSFLMGAGLVNAYRAIAGRGGQAPATPSDFTAATQSNNLRISVRVPEDKDDGIPYSIIIYYNISDFSETSSDLMFSQLYLEDEKPGDIIEATLTGLDFNTVYYVAAAAEDLAGNKSDITGRVVVTTGDNTPPAIEALGSTELTIKPWQKASLDFKISDPDGHYFSIELINETPGISLDTLVRDMPKVVVDGAETASGSYTVTLEVVDIYGAGTRQNMLITVLDNHSPAVLKEIGDRIYTQGVATEELICSEYFKDEDGEDLKYSYSIDNETVVNMTGQEGKFYITPMNYGYATVSVTGTDIRGDSATQSFRVLVRDGSRSVDIYPNPVTDFLYVRTSESASASLKLIDVLGVTIYEQALTITPFEPAKVDMAGFASGIYTVILNYAGNITKTQIYKR